LEDDIRDFVLKQAALDRRSASSMANKLIELGIRQFGAISTPNLNEVGGYNVKSVTTVDAQGGKLNGRK
jgi:hypothetical protein